MIAITELNRLKNYQLRSIHRQLKIRISKPARKPNLVSNLEMYQKRGEVAAEKLKKVYDAVVYGDGPQVKNQEIDPEQIKRMIKAQLVTEKLFNPEDLSKRVMDQISGTLDETIKAYAQKSLNKYRPIEIVSQGRRKKMRDVLPDEFERILQLASQRVNVMMVGPAGCGKTYIGRKVAEALGLPFSSISCSAGMSESQLAGWLLPVGTSGRFEYVPSPFVEMYEKGGVFLLDEIDAADPNTLTFINKAIANESFFVPQRHKKPEVKKHKNFVCLAACNTYGNGADAQFVGRNQLDAATLDRFRAGMITMDYSERVERELVRPDVLEWGLRIRKIINQHKMRRIMSTRVMIEMTKMAEAYDWKEPQWAESYFVDWSADELKKLQGDSNGDSQNAGQNSRWQ